MVKFTNPLSSINAISTLSRDLGSIKKPPIASIAKVAMMMSPMGIAGAVAVVGGGIAAKEIYDHRAEIKSTLHSVGHKIETSAVVVESTVAKAGTSVVSGIGKVGTSVGNGFERMMLPVMVVGGVVVLIMILKK